MPRREQPAHEGTWIAADRRAHVARRCALRPCLRKDRPADRRCATVMPSPANWQDRGMCNGERRSSHRTLRVPMVGLAVDYIGRCTLKHAFDRSSTPDMRAEIERIT